MGGPRRVGTVVEAKHPGNAEHQHSRKLEELEREVHGGERQKEAGRSVTVEGVSRKSGGVTKQRRGAGAA